MRTKNHATAGAVVGAGAVGAAGAVWKLPRTPLRVMSRTSSQQGKTLILISIATRSWISTPNWAGNQDLAGSARIVAVGVSEIRKRKATRAVRIDLRGMELQVEVNLNQTNVAAAMRVEGEASAATRNAVTASAGRVNAGRVNAGQASEDKASADRVNEDKASEGKSSADRVNEDRVNEDKASALRQVRVVPAIRAAKSGANTARLAINVRQPVVRFIQVMMRSTTICMPPALMMMKMMNRVKVGFRRIRRFPLGRKPSIC